MKFIWRISWKYARFWEFLRKLREGLKKSLNFPTFWEIPLLPPQKSWKILLFFFIKVGKVGIIGPTSLPYWKFPTFFSEPFPKKFLRLVIDGNIWDDMASKMVKPFLGSFRDSWHTFFLAVAGQATALKWGYIVWNE